MKKVRETKADKAAIVPEELPATPDTPTEEGETSAVKKTCEKGEKLMFLPDPDKGKDAMKTAGVIRPMIVRRSNPIYSAMHFNGMFNLPEVMQWLADDFYALTAGDPITINHQVIALDKGEKSAEALANLLLVIHDPIANCYHVVTPGSWIIKDGDLGYSIMNDKRFHQLYEDAVGDPM